MVGDSDVLNSILMSMFHICAHGPPTLRLSIINTYPFFVRRCALLRCSGYPLCLHRLQQVTLIERCAICCSGYFTSGAIILTWPLNFPSFSVTSNINLNIQIYNLVRNRNTFRLQIKRTVDEDNICKSDSGTETGKIAYHCLVNIFSHESSWPWSRCMKLKFK